MSKIMITVILSIIAIVGGLILNFQEFLMGSPANSKNLVVTLFYVVIWCFVLFVAIKNKSRKTLIYISIYWVITLIISVNTIYVNATEALDNWALPFVVLMMGQFYGVNYFTSSFLSSSIIISAISLGMSLVAVVSIRRLDTVCRN